MHRFRIFLTVILGLSLAVLVVPASAKKSEKRCFPETGNCITSRLLSFWEQNGGLSVFGYPITNSKQQDTSESSIDTKKDGQEIAHPSIISTCVY